MTSTSATKVPIEFNDKVVRQFMLASVIFGVVATFVLVRGISRPATAIASTLQTMSTGNLDIKVPETDRGDEMGDIADRKSVV